MDSYPERVHDPLLFLNTDKSDLDAFLMNTSAEMAHLADEFQANVTDVKMENSLDLDSLEGNGHLGDMSWLHNSSMSTLAHLDNDDTSDGTMISVNPQSVLPMQIIQREKPEHLLSSETANSAAMRLHANCSNLLAASGNDHSMQQQQATQSSAAANVVRQEHQTIRILSVASHSSPHNSPVKTQNYLITSSRDSPHKGQTFVLSTTNGQLPAGLTITTSNSPNRSSTAGSQFLLSSPQKLHAITTDKTGRVLLKSGNNLLSPSQASPVLLGRLQTGVQPQQLYQNATMSAGMCAASASAMPSDAATVSSTTNIEERQYPKPSYSYSCLIALALKNSKNGSLPVSEIYNFMCENFPYFKTAPDGWKNSVRHNLSLNKCFAKVDNPKLSQGAKKGCLWALNPLKIAKMEDEINKWGRKDPAGLLSSMAYPENLEAIEKGQAGLHYAKKKQAETAPCTPRKAEATPTKVEYSPMVKQEFAPIDNYNPNIRVDKVEQRTPVKGAEYGAVGDDFSPMQKDYNPHSSRSHTHLRIDGSDLSFLEIPASMSNDALTDMVLQNSVWDEDLENNIDIDLICDSPSAFPVMPVQSPARSSPNLALLQHSTGQGHYSPSVHPMYNNIIHSSPVQQANPSPATVRANLYGVTTPTRRTLYT